CSPSSRAPLVVVGLRRAFEHRRAPRSGRSRRSIRRNSVRPRRHALYVGHQLLQIHAAQRFKQRRHLRGNLRHLARQLVRARRLPVTRGHNRDLVYVRQRLAHRAHDVRKVRDQLVDDRGLRPLLVRRSLHVHRLLFGIALLEDDRSLGLALSANGRRPAFGLSHQPRLLGVGHVLDALLLDLRLLQHSGDQFLLVALDLGLLHLHLRLFFNLLHLHLFGDNLLLHHVRLQLIGLVRRRLLTLRRLGKLCLLHVEIALRLCLLRQRHRLREHALLVRRRLRHRGFAQCNRAPDRRIALRFHCRNLRVALDACNVGPPHVGDVLVLVAHFLDGEAHHHEPHLAHVLGACRAHALAHHFRLFHNLLDRELADDAAQMAFHYQPDQAFALLRRLVQELLGRGHDALLVGSHLDLRHSFHRHRHALPRIKILLRRHVEAHQLQREGARMLHHRINERAMADDYPRSTQAVANDRLIRPSLAIHARQRAHDHEQRQHHQSNHHDFVIRHTIPFSNFRRTVAFTSSSVAAMKSPHCRTPSPAEQAEATHWLWLRNAPRFRRTTPSSISRQRSDSRRRADSPHTRSEDSTSSWPCEIRKSNSAAQGPSAAGSTPQSAQEAARTHRARSFASLPAAQTRLAFHQSMCKLIPTPHVRHALRVPHHNHFSAALNRRSIFRPHHRRPARAVLR